MQQTAPQMKYRIAVLDDLPRLLELEQLVIEAERPFNASIKSDKTAYYDIRHLICNCDSHLIVCEDDEDIIGTGYAQVRESKISLEHEFHSYLGFMYVSPAYRGRGINKKILEDLVAWSQQRGARDLYLDVYVRNNAAIKAYQKAGFEPCMMEMKLRL